MATSVAQLADQLGVDGKVIRRYLRSTYQRPSLSTRWDLTPEQVENIIATFEGRGTISLPRGGADVPLYIRKKNPNVVSLASDLKSNPQDLIISTNCGPITVYQIIGKYTSGYSRRTGRSKVWSALLSNGTFVMSTDPGVPNREWMIESQYCLYKHEEAWHINHKDYVKRVCSLGTISRELLDPLLLSNSTGSLDTPQEVLITHYTRRVEHSLTPSAILFQEVKKKPISDFTLTEVINLERINVIELELERVSRLSYQHSPLRSSLARYFATINLIKELPRRSQAFEITLGEVFRRFGLEIEEKASEICLEVAQKLGFEKTDDGWRKSAGGYNVLVDNDLKVYINRQFICITSAKTVDLPYADEVARRMLGVATAHRNQISTITREQRSVLETLFPPEVPSFTSR